MEENESVEMQEVAEPVEEVVETSEQTQEVAEPEPQQEVEQPKVEERNYEKDAAFARMRRELETATAEKEKFLLFFSRCYQKYSYTKSTFEHSFRRSAVQKCFFIYFSSSGNAGPICFWSNCRLSGWPHFQCKVSAPVSAL